MYILSYTHTHTSGLYTNTHIQSIHQHPLYTPTFSLYTHIQSIHKHPLYTFSLYTHIQFIHKHPLYTPTSSLYTIIHSTQAHPFIHPHPVYTPPTYTHARPHAPLLYLLFRQVGVHVAVPWVRHRFGNGGCDKSPLPALVTLHPGPPGVPETVQQP